MINPVWSGIIVTFDSQTLAKSLPYHLFALSPSSASSRLPFLKLVFKCVINRILPHRRGLAIESTGTFPGDLAADLTRWPMFFNLFCLPDVPKWSFLIVTFPNKSIINWKVLTGSIALHICSTSVKRFWTESIRRTWGRRGNWQKIQLHVAKLLTWAGFPDNDWS